MYLYIPAPIKHVINANFIIRCLNNDVSL
jgi:hypothetical protein